MNEKELDFLQKHSEKLHKCREDVRWFARALEAAKLEFVNALFELNAFLAEKENE